MPISLLLSNILFTMPFSFFKNSKKMNWDTSRTCDAVISRLIAPLGQENRGVWLVSMLVSLYMLTPVKAAMYKWFQGFHGEIYA
jgi:hypothetical protein